MLQSLPATCAAATDFFRGGKPVDQNEKSFFADLPPGNRSRFQANLEGVASAGEFTPSSDSNYSVAD